MERNQEVPWENSEPVTPKPAESEDQKKADKALFGGTKAGKSKETPFKKAGPESFEDAKKLLTAVEKMESAAIDEEIDRIGEIFTDIEDLHRTLIRQEQGVQDLKALEKHGDLTDAMLVERINEAIGMIDTAKKDIERSDAAGSEGSVTDLADLDKKLHTLRAIKEARIQRSGIEKAQNDIDSPVIVDPKMFEGEMPAKAGVKRPALKRREAQEFPMQKAAPKYIEEEPTTLRRTREDGTVEKNYGLTPENPATKKPKGFWEKGLDLLKGKKKK